jgi:hypothetical protein
MVDMRQMLTPASAVSTTKERKKNTPTKAARGLPWEGQQAT